MPEKPTYEELERQVRDLKETQIALLKTKVALKDSDEKYRKTFECITDSITVTRIKDGRYLYVNDGFCIQTQYSREEVLGRTPFDINLYAVPAERDQFVGILEKFGKAENIVTHFRRKNGEMYYSEFSAKPILYGGEKCLLAQSRDITDRKLAEEALREREKQNRLLVENISDVVWMMDMNFQNTYVSPSVYRQRGFTPEEVRNQSLSERMTSASIEKVLNLYCEKIKLIEAGNPEGWEAITFEIEQPCKDGSYIWTSNTVRVLPGPDKKPAGILGTTQNITERKLAEESLVKSESLFRGLFNNMTSGSAIYEVINDGSKGSHYIVKSFNKRSLEIEGKTLDQVVGKSLFDLRPNIDDYGLIPVMQKVWETGEPGYLPIKIYEDERFSSYYENFIFKIPTGEVVTVYNDVTDNKNSEVALKESEERFAIAMAFANDGLFDWNLETNNIYYSPGWKRMLGYEDDELPNDFSVWEKLTHPDDVKRSWKMQKELLNGKREKFEIEFQMKHKGGHWVDILSRANAIFDEDNTAVRIVGTHIDISERKIYERAIAEEKELFKAVFEQAGGYCMILQPTDNGIPTILDANEAACKTHGYKKEEMIGRPVADLDDDEGKRLCRERTKTILSGETLNIETNHVRKDGSIFPVEVFANIVRFRKKAPLIVTTEFDISKRRNSEDEKIYLERQLFQAQKLESIGNLAGGIAHDFNNILSSIIGFTEIALYDAPKNTTLEDSLQEVYSAGKRAKDLVKQILAFARQSDERRTPVQPKLIINEVLKFIRSTIPTTIEIKQDVGSDSFIMGNATQLHQVVMNICTNAAHSMEDTGGILKVGLKDVVSKDKESLVGMRQGNYIEIKIADTGVGIRPEFIEYIFDPYFTTKAPGEGTGMGLAVAHGIIESYDGKITVESQLGKGTAFTIYLPVSKTRSDLDAYVPEQSPTGTEHILFVDDELPIAKMGALMLERLGYLVTTQTNSIEALELFRTRYNDFDLVVTDMTMPNMTGDKLAIELMKIRSDIPVILCTGYSKKISEETAVEIGIRAFAYKPIIKADLAKTIRKVLDDAQA